LHSLLYLGGSYHSIGSSRGLSANFLACAVVRAKEIVYILQGLGAHLAKRILVRRVNGDKPFFIITK
jgi:hypothetical protein